jgi:biopolymer transport protein ExbD/biopolymer transport protein TolR
MRFKKIKDEEPRLGITPLIDIVFLLLIFFMVTSHFHMASGVSIKLPKVTQRTLDKDSEKITLMIDRQGRTYLKGDIIDLKNLATQLRDLVVKEGLTHLLLEADKDVAHGKVVQVMDLAKSAGVLSIIIAANWKPEKVL